VSTVASTPPEMKTQSQRFVGPSNGLDSAQHKLQPLTPAKLREEDYNNGNNFIIIYNQINASERFDHSELGIFTVQFLPQITQIGRLFLKKKKLSFTF